VEAVGGDDVTGPVVMAEASLVITALAEVDERLSEISLLDKLVTSLVVVGSAVGLVCSGPSDVVTEIMTDEASVPV